MHVYVACVPECCGSVCCASQLSAWISYVRRMDSNRRLSHILYYTIILKETTKRTTKTDGGTVYKQILINTKLQIGTELSGRSQLRSGRCLTF
jgi:hypothetical protein